MMRGGAEVLARRCESTLQICIMMLPMSFFVHRWIGGEGSQQSEAVQKHVMHEPVGMSVNRAWVHIHHALRMITHYFKVQKPVLPSRSFSTSC